METGKGGKGQGNGGTGWPGAREKPWVLDTSQQDHRDLQWIRILGAGEVNGHPSCLECLERQGCSLTSPLGKRGSAFGGMLSLIQSDLARFQFRKTIQ